MLFKRPKDLVGFLLSQAARNSRQGKPQARIRLQCHGVSIWFGKKTKPV